MSIDHVAAFHTACRTVLANSASPALRYAVGYADAGTFLTDPEACRVQCLSILNTLTGWRGPEATEARRTFKKLSQAKAWAEFSAPTA